MAQFDLLRKTELRIEGISLRNVNLNDIADTVSDLLGMHRNDVLVTDLHDDIMTIDILKTCIDGYDIVGKKEMLLQKLAKLPGVNITKRTSICSDGMLGWIAFDEGKAREALKRSEKMAKEICRKISKKVIVFSTGFEVTSGQVKDTNTPTIVDRLEAEGYSVTQGPTLRDDEVYIAAKLRQAIQGDGYGLVITTGGIGAEGKDRTIEAVLALDPEAATPYICRYQKGTGRHMKDGVRIAVGKACDTLIVALPGPNDEVRSSLDVLVKGLQSKLDKNMLSEKIAGNLRKGLREKMAHRDKKDGSEQLPQDLC